MVYAIVLGISVIFYGQFIYQKPYVHNKENKTDIVDIV